MQPGRQTALFVGIGIFAALIVLNAVVSYWQTRQLQGAADWVAHTYRVIANQAELASTIKDAETGIRGYVIAGDEAYLEPYHDAVAKYPERLRQLTALAADNPFQQKHLPRLRELIDERFKILADRLALVREQGLEASRASIGTGRGKEVMNQIRSLVDELQEQERELLVDRQRADRAAYDSSLFSLLLVTALGLIGTGAFGWLLRTHLEAQRNSAAELFDQREFLRATLTSIGDAVIATDAQGRLTFLNTVAENLTGWTQQEALGQPLDEVFHIVNEETRGPVPNPALRALGEGQIVGLANHTVLISRNQEEWPIDDSAAPIRAQDGRLTGAVLVFREIRERKRQELELRQYVDALRDANHHKDALMAELRDADRHKDEFLATLAHELRNPLSPLSNALQLWPLVENDPAELERLRGLMERQIRQISRLINDLMDVSRISRGRIQLQKQPVDLGTVISGAVESVQALIDANAQRLTVALPAQTVIVDGDVARLTQVFGNILHNATKYAGRNGVIWIAAERHDGRVAVSIRDNGPGIPQTMLPQVFEMFRQLNQAEGRAVGGLGIGLSLVKKLVDLHGGTVEAKSEGPGQGSEFVVTLPTDSSDPAEPQPRHVMHHVPSLPRHRILVVDDVDASARTLAMMLRSLGQDVVTANDGAAAIEQTFAYRPDVVFLDIAMPEMSGYDVARRLRAEEGLNGLVIVALTGYGQEEDRRKAIEAGFNHHLVKPTSMEELTQVLLTVPTGG